MRSSDVVIVGSGFTGLLAAQALRGEGMRVRLVDKAARPGGRLSTRRVGDSGIDSGIRSFEIRDGQVMEALASLAGDCLQITDQRHGWHVTWDGTARQLAAALVAPMTVQTALVTHLRPTNGGVRLGLWGTDEQAVSRWVILTAPAPQSHLLLQRSGLTMAGRAPHYERRLVLLAALTEKPSVAAGSVVFDQVEAWPRGDRWLLRARVTSQESARMWDHDATHTLAGLLLELAGVTGGVSVVAADCMRWRYAFATGVTPASHSQVDGLPVLLGGDGFGADNRREASVERACRSGLDMAARVIASG
jgi:predicted NAD/FAD-dependent oxidoreductase